MVPKKNSHGETGGTRASDESAGRFWKRLNIHENERSLDRVCVLRTAAENCC